MKYSLVKLNSVTENFDKIRIPLSQAERELRKGIYPYYGAQGVIDWIDDYLFSGEYLLIAEDGENLKSNKEPIAQIANGNFWVNNHAHVLKNNEKSDLHYLYYIINRTDIRPYLTGSVQPKLNQSNLNKIELKLPELKYQK
ncbi:restriction endonuclease subunit S, partial [Enterococcus faecium]|nr:restriction endonuclease subunit S [Enterococcus faecium]